METEITHQVTLYTDYKSSQGRYAICDGNGDVLWYGRLFDGALEQSKGELDAALKAVWLAWKIREEALLDTIQLNLKVDAEWLIYQDHPKQKGFRITEKCRKYNIILNIEWIPGKENPADKWTVASGYKKWSDNDLKVLAEKLEL